MARKSPLEPGGPRPTVPAERTLSPKWGQSVPNPKSGQSGRSTAVEAPENPGLASERLRTHMIDRLRRCGGLDEAVLAAMAVVPRHRFVDAALASRAYEDTALPIGHAQTISQPYVVARSLSLALEALKAPSSGMPIQARALEIGTGCGYQAAVMAQLFAEVISVERIEPLHRSAADRLRLLGFQVELVLADGQQGLNDPRGFEVIVMAAGMPHPPTELLRQLCPSGVFVGPIGSPDQRLVVIQRVAEQQFQTHSFDMVQFVPIRSGVQP